MWLVLAVLLLLAAVASAQSPAQQIPDWIIKYTQRVETARQQCEVTLAQTEFKADQLQKELDAKAKETKEKK